nr:hypothetical protein [Acidobacteriota bacterium]
MSTKITRRLAKVSGVVVLVWAGSLLAALCACTAAVAQTNSFHDGGTPAESKQGSATASSYDRERVETVNLANGNFSMSLPLTTVGGRGSASYTLSLSYNSKLWSATHEAEKPAGCLPAPCTESPTVHHFSAVYDAPSMVRPNSVALGGGWSILKGPYVKRTVPSVLIDPIPCPSSSNLGTCYKYALTKAWLLLPDGSEVELRDALTNGAPYLLPSLGTSQVDRDRGRVWQSRDGSNVTYVTDAPNGVVNGQFSGWVFLADGTRLRMEGQRCTKVIDRNGNYVTIEYGTTGGATYTDPLGRQTILQPVATGATVTVKGYGGTPDRVFTVETGVIGAKDAAGVLSNLRSDFRTLPRPFTGGDAFRDQNGLTSHTITAPHTDLFPDSEGGDAVDGARAVTRLSLPDGRALRFRYNQYGEVAEVVYPGGGASRVDYQGFQSKACEGYEPFSATLNRRVVKRQSLSNGSAPDATWTYVYGLGGTNPQVTVEARQGDGEPTDALLASEKHFFLAVDAEYRVCRPTASNGTFYEKWENAKVYRVERQTGAGTQVTTRLWQQRAPVVWGNDPGYSFNNYAAAHGQEQPANDPRVVREETTLENGKTKRVEYAYDRFNNVTSVKESDFGTTAAPGALLRQTVRRYAGSGTDLAVNGYCYTNLDPQDETCGAGLAADPATIIHQKSVLLSESVRDGAGAQQSYVEYEYDKYLADGSRAALTVNAGMIRYDGARFAAFAAASQPRGNVTRVARWLGGTSYVYSYSRYDNAGNVVSAKDPRGHVSSASYADNFGNGTNPDLGTVGTNGTTFAFPTLATNALGHQARTQYSYNYGAPAGVKDANGVVTRTDYDTLGRPVRVTAAQGLAEEAVTETSYPTATVNATHASTELDATRWVSARTQFDGFGRPAVSSASEDGKHYATAAFSLHTKTVYDALGRPAQVSNPHRAGQTPVYTATAYDLSGRVTSVTTPDGAKVLTGYDGEAVMVTDQAGKKRISRSDALGRLADVWEVTGADAATVAVVFGGVTYNGYRTSYRYDVLDNLRKVDQGGQLRFFAYDPLSRLVRAKNPEQGLMATDTDFSVLTDSTSGTANSQWSLGYLYDASGNLIKRKDARGVVTTYGYDALGRNTAALYSDATPDVTRSYDGALLGKGRPWKSEAAANSLTTTSEYDALGRPERQQQQFWAGAAWGTAFAVARAYDRAGNVLAQTYPSGRATNYTYDGAGRLASFSGNLGDGVQRSYSSAVIYHESGGMSQERFGTVTPLYSKRFYNVRGQLSEVRLGTQSITSADPGHWNRGAILNVYSAAAGWTESGADNNGSLRKQMVFVPNDDAISGWWQTNFFYDYDALNRIDRVREVQGGQNQWLQEFDYDRWGNRTVNAAATQVYGASPAYSIPEPQFTVNTTNNRLGVPAGQPGVMQYDPAGNLTQDTYTGAGARTYDAEGRMTSAQFVSGQPQTAAYAYDADGRRVKRDVGASAEVWQVYGIGGELLAEYGAGAAPSSPQKEYGYRAGGLLITAEAGSAAAPPPGGGMPYG